MNILFVTFKSLSVGSGALRSVAFLRALADAGHRIDVIAPEVDAGNHPNIHILVNTSGKSYSRKKLRLALFRAVGGRHYDAVHAIDDAVLLVSRLCRLRRIKLVYEASRCFSGSDGDAPCWYWRFLRKRSRRLERKALTRSTLIFSSCEYLTSSLNNRADKIRVMQVDDVPAQTLYPNRDPDPDLLSPGFSGRADFLVVIRVLLSKREELRTLLLAARKVIDAYPGAYFIFKGADAQPAQELATNLDLQARCLFLENHEMDKYLTALSMANAVLFVPQSGQRYPHPEILTLLNSPAMLVAVNRGVYPSMLSESNSVQVEYTATSISEGILRAVQEPLLAFGMISEAHQMIADHHAFSSFKHRIRMAYHELSKVH